MFNIKICSYDQSHGLMQTWATKTLSLLDPDLRDVEQPNSYRHIGFFNDITHPIYGWVMPTMAHFLACMNFSLDFKDDDNVLIHCHAGVSRSTAIAIAVLIQHGMNVNDAVDKIFEVRDCMWPNATLISLADVHFGLGGSLIDHVKLWKMEQETKLIIVRSEADRLALETSKTEMKNWLKLLDD
jgi:predicted protein tyrosine phosphatase